MNKKGFTLIELIAVVVIIALLSIIVLPTIINQFANKKDEISKLTSQLIIDAAELYASENHEYNKIITLNDLIKDEKLESPVMDNKTGKEIPLSKQIKINKKGIACIIGIDGCDTTLEPDDYKETILNGTDPVLKGRLVPVIIGENGTVKKADTTMEWYNYQNKKWANAVLLTGKDTYRAGATIKENKIKAYFVWIPKYSYKLWDMGNYTSVGGTQVTPHAIDIKFGVRNTTDSETECVAPNTSGASGNCAVGKYMTHPAFTSLSSNGIWVGKFEATGSISDITVKPKTTQINSQNVKAMFQAAYNYNRTLDSHMMKNTEWGATIYLGHSVYGYTSGKAITNNNSAPLSAWSAKEGYQSGSGSWGESDTTKSIEYPNSGSENSSINRNITGIYDMTGGMNEFVAAYMQGSLGNSGFTTNDSELTNTKYIDIYNSSSSEKGYQYRILGDATGELGPFNSSYLSGWYNSPAYFVMSSKPWFMRGGAYSNAGGANQFTFNNRAGGAESVLGFRLVLSPQ